MSGLVQASSIQLYQRASIQDACSVHHAWQGAGQAQWQQRGSKWAGLNSVSHAILIDVLYVESPKLTEFRMSLFSDVF